ncbi:AAA domain-containing protein [Pseudomonas duriflava]|uniref:AAA domain-containing protein n=1 Tax=Pseudomonas duriflava TaxID=459528 RepID=A0A562QAB6_9PSED|nr:DEAD/DEAH box helicase [Pseudomonas duriflava]TWI53692.1 AAA domain-containing protein [Pseudomonas duriflava]
MLSAVKRYLAGALSSYFPRTTEYLKDPNEGGLSHPKPSSKAASALTSKLKAALLPKKRVQPKPGRTTTKKSARNVTKATAKSGAKSSSKAGTASRRGKSTAGAKKPAKASGKRDKPAGVDTPQHQVVRDVQVGEGIYDATPLMIDDTAIKAMRKQVAEAVRAGVVSMPSDEQWSMILCSSPATRIFAGAGSGKSTTLVLRVVFMLCHMRIKPERITVISFTNDSCAQLRDQLSRVLAFWSYPFEVDKAQRCVRTFHAAMGVLAKELLGNPSWFEQLDDRKSFALELDNPLAAGRLRPAQQRLLKQTYQTCYAQVPAFRRRVHKLLGLPMPEADDQEQSSAVQAPLDGFRLAGEFTSVPLFEAFYTQAGFIESIGIRLDQLDVKTIACSTRERIFLEALVLFWKAFEKDLQGQGLMTFNRAFQALTERLAAEQSSISTEILVPYSHLLIDEFQDISPQIVQWLQALHRCLAKRGEAVSLMAIGDDWQSIYGWRGSSPELFMNFDRYFPSKGRTKKSAVLMLETNYRSVEPILRDGEAVLSGVAYKQDKVSKAHKPTKPGDHGVQVVSPFDVHKRLPDLIKEIENQCAYAASCQSRERIAVLVLARRNETLKIIQGQLQKSLPVKCYTIHRAKGLQAEVALIVDDGMIGEEHPLRNTLYAYSGFFRNSYSQAMADEGLRLAYVAITRGVSRVLWYARKPHEYMRVLRTSET